MRENSAGATLTARRPGAGASPPSNAHEDAGERLRRIEVYDSCMCAFLACVHVHLAGGGKGVGEEGRRVLARSRPVWQHPSGNTDGGCM